MNEDFIKAKVIALKNNFNFFMDSELISSWVDSLGYFQTQTLTKAFGYHLDEVDRMPTKRAFLRFCYDLEPREIAEDSEIEWHKYSAEAKDKWLAMKDGDSVFFQPKPSGPWYKMRVDVISKSYKQISNEYLDGIMHRYKFTRDVLPELKRDSLCIEIGDAFLADRVIDEKFCQELWGRLPPEKKERGEFQLHGCHYSLLKKGVEEKP